MTLSALWLRKYKKTKQVKHEKQKVISVLTF
jgi:hypothetical protein